MLPKERVESLTAALIGEDESSTRRELAAAHVASVVDLRSSLNGIPAEAEALGALRDIVRHQDVEPEIYAAVVENAGQLGSDEYSLQAVWEIAESLADNIRESGRLPVDERDDTIEKNIQNGQALVRYLSSAVEILDPELLSDFIDKSAYKLGSSYFIPSQDSEHLWSSIQELHLGILTQIPEPQPEHVERAIGVVGNPSSRLDDSAIARGAKFALENISLTLESSPGIDTALILVKSNGDAQVTALGMNIALQNIMDKAGPDRRKYDSATSQKLRERESSLSRVEHALSRLPKRNFLVGYRKRAKRNGLRKERAGTIEEINELKIAGYRPSWGFKIKMDEFKRVTQDRTVLLAQTEPGQQFLRNFIDAAVAMHYPGVDAAYVKGLYAKGFKLKYADFTGARVPSMLDPEAIRSAYEFLKKDLEIEIEL